VDDRSNFMSPRPLSAGSQINGYKIREVLGMGGLGITYRAHDSKLDREVAIREYLPTAYALRHINFSVKPISGEHKNRYEQGLANFLDVANSLNQFSHENIVKVHSVVEANDTAYMVMECEHGVGLDAIIDQCDTLEQNHQIQIFFPLFDGLKKIHELGFVHLSIKPSNIRIRENGSPVLLDFGSSRQIESHQPIESTALLNQGYMPLEQYSADYGRQGPWTDIYSLAAIMYQGVTGTKPDEALIRSDYLLRSQSDTVQPLLAAKHPTYKQSFLSALHSGLTLQPELRPQNLTLWQLLFDGDLEAFRHQSANAENSATDSQSSNLARATTIGSQHQRTHGTTNQPLVNDVENTTNESVDEVDIPLGSNALADSDNEFLKAGVLAAQPENQSGGLKSLVVGSAVVASIALVIGVMFLQNKTTQIEPANSLEQSNSMATTDQTISDSVINEKDDLAVASGANKQMPPIGSNNVTAMVENANALSSLAMSDTADSLAISTSTDSTANLTADDSFDSDASFGQSANSETASATDAQAEPADVFTVLFNQPLPNDPQESLCDQGIFYNSVDNKNINRIQHPFGGYYKLALKNWAGNECG